MKNMHNFNMKVSILHLQNEIVKAKYGKETIKKIDDKFFNF